MALISSYSDDAATTDTDRFLTYASDGATKLTPASNVNQYVGPGWILSADSWTFSSYNSTTAVGVINANSGANTKYSAGMWIRFSQPTLGTKYAVVTASTSTTITAKFKSGTVLSNEAITSPVYSTSATPFGATQTTPEMRTGGFFFKTHTFTNATGTQTITGVGFTPKAIMVNGPNRNDTGAGHSNSGQCWYNGSAYVQAANSLYTATSVPRSKSSTSSAFIQVNAAGTGFVFEAAVTGFSEDTITVNVVTSSADAGFSTYQVMAFA